MECADPKLKSFVEEILIPFNILIFEALAFIFLGIVKRMGVALLMEMIPVCVFSVANSYVRMFRGSFIMPWDFISIRTAANVAGNYSYTMDVNARNGLMGFIFLAIFTIITLGVGKTDLTIVKRALLIVDRKSVV